MASSTSSSCERTRLIVLRWPERAVGRGDRPRVGAGEVELLEVEGDVLLRDRLARDPVHELPGDLGVQRFDLEGRAEGAYHLGGSAGHAVPDFAGRSIAVSTLEGELAILNAAVSALEARGRWN